MHELFLRVGIEVFIQKYLAIILYHMIANESEITKKKMTCLLKVPIPLFTPPVKKICDSTIGRYDQSYVFSFIWSNDNGVLYAFSISTLILKSSLKEHMCYSHQKLIV